MGRHDDAAAWRGGTLALRPPLRLRRGGGSSDAAAPGAHAAAAASPLGRRTPEEGVGRPVVLAGEAQQAPAGGRQADGVDKVLQDAVLHVGQRVVAQRLLQEEAHQRGLESLVAQLAQRLQDAGDAQVVVLGPEEVGLGRWGGEEGSTVTERFF